MEDVKHCGCCVAAKADLLAVKLLLQDMIGPAWQAWLKARDSVNEWQGGGYAPA